MQKCSWLAFVIWALLLSVTSVRAEGGGDAVVGLWHTSENKSVVRIFKRGKEYCAEVASLGQPNFPADDKQGMGGKPRIDRNNPKAELRKRPLVGIQFMSGMVFAGGNHWSGGSIYDPESGNTYRSKMTLLSSGKLELRGYIGISLFGRSTTWTR